MQLPQSQPVTPKQTQFLEEINEISARYQFSLVPVLSYSSKGILPSFAIIEVIPPKKEVKKEGKK